MDKKSIIIVTIVAIIIVAAAAVYLLMPRSTTNYTGDWEVQYSELMDTSGNVTEVSAEKATIEDVNNQLFCGEFMGQDVTGTIEDNWLYFEVENDNIYIALQGEFWTDDIMVAILLIHDYSGDGNEFYAGNAIYTRNNADYKDLDLDPLNIEGNLYSMNGYYAVNDSTTDLETCTCEIIKQVGNAAVYETTVGSETYRGVMALYYYHEIYDSAYGLLLTAEGNFGNSGMWGLFKIGADEFEYTLRGAHNGNTYVVGRYTSELPPTVCDLDDTDWCAAEHKEMTVEGKYFVHDEYIGLSITYQKYNMIYGTMYIGESLTEYAFAGCIWEYSDGTWWIEFTSTGGDYFYNDMYLMYDEDSNLITSFERPMATQESTAIGTMNPLNE